MHVSSKVSRKRLLGEWTEMMKTNRGHHAIQRMGARRSLHAWDWLRYGCGSGSVSEVGTGGLHSTPYGHGDALLSPAGDVQALAAA